MGVYTSAYTGAEVDAGIKKVSDASQSGVSVQYDLMPIESIHPQAQGYYQMADIMFSTLSAHI